MKARGLHSRGAALRALGLGQRTLGAALLALLAACGSAPTRLFTLDAVPPAAGSAVYGGPPLRVDAVHMPPELDRIEIVSRIAPGELAIDDLDHWSAPLAVVARQALSADLAARLPQGRLVFPHLAKPEGALGISVDVLEFKTSRSGAALEVSWVIDPAHEPGASRATAVFTTAQGAGDAASTARALGILLGQLADRIVADLLAMDRAQHDHE